MPENEELMRMSILLWFCAGGVLVGLVMLFRLRSRLIRIERALYGAELRREAAVHKEGGDKAGNAENPGGGVFEAFLAEDPARKDLPKKEQFAAYRKWRQEKGLNWTRTEADGAEENGVVN